MSGNELSIGIVEQESCTLCALVQRGNALHARPKLCLLVRLASLVCPSPFNVLNRDHAPLADIAATVYKSKLCVS